MNTSCKCRGCIDNQANQEAHMGRGGCLAQPGYWLDDDNEDNIILEINHDEEEKGENPILKYENILLRLSKIEEENKQLHLCTFQTPTLSAEMSAKETLPRALQMRKGVKQFMTKKDKIEQLRLKIMCDFKNNILDICILKRAPAPEAKIYMESKFNKCFCKRIRELIDYYQSSYETELFELLKELDIILLFNNEEKNPSPMYKTIFMTHSIPAKVCPGCPGLEFAKYYAGILEELVNDFTMFDLFNGPKSTGVNIRIDIKNFNMKLLKMIKLFIEELLGITDELLLFTDYI